MLTYYDERAAQALRNVWGGTAMTPALGRNSAQFPEGSIIVKVALFASANPAMQLNWWDALAGAAVWPLYVPPAPLPPPPPAPQGPPPQVWAGYVAQMDIIVKDSASAPDTGWVFTTLVYDGRLPGDAWDRMIPLGAQWGNDAQAARAGLPLTQNWINPARAALFDPDARLGRAAFRPERRRAERHRLWRIGDPRRHRRSERPRFELHELPQHRPVERRGAPDSHLPAADRAGGPERDALRRQRAAQPQRQLHLLSRARLGAMDDVVPESPGQPADERRLDRDRLRHGVRVPVLPLWWAAVGPANQPMPLLLRAPNATRGRNLYTGAPLPRR